MEHKTFKLIEKYHKHNEKAGIARLKLEKQLLPITAVMGGFAPTISQHIKQISALDDGSIAVTLESRCGGFSQPRQVRIYIPKEIMESSDPVAEATRHRQLQLEQCRKTQQRWEDYNDNVA